jgi:hypothetical protein
MPKKKVMHIGEYGEKFLKKNLLTSDGYTLRRCFAECLGPQLAKYAALVKISKNSLYVSVQSAVVKNEIMLMRRQILKVMNEASAQSDSAERKVFDKIVIV